MKRPLWLFFACVTLSAQQNPTLDAFIFGIGNALRVTDSEITNMPQPRIPITAQLPTSYVPLGSTTVNATLDTLLRNGITEVSFYPDPVLFACDSHYAGAIVVPGGCATFNAYLSVIDSMFTHAAAQGQHIWGGFTVPSATLQSVCSLTNTTTAAQYETCVKPLLVAMAQRYGSAAAPVIGGGWKDIQILEEPSTTALVLGFAQFTGADVGTNPGSSHGWGTTDVDAFLTNVSTAIHAVIPSFKTAATIAGDISCAIGGCDQGYFIDWAQTTPGTLVDEIWMDVFNSTCNPAKWPADMDNYASMAQLAKANGWHMGIGQTSPPRHCPIGGGSPTEANAYEGNGYTVWATSNLYQNWLLTERNWAAANGFDLGMSLFCAPPIWYVNDTTNKCSTGTYTTDAISHLAESTSIGAAVHALNAGNALSAQGGLSITGGITFLSQ